MADKRGPEDFTKIRRRGRGIADEEWIKRFLHRGVYGTVATADGGQPFINYMAYVFDENANAIYFHSALKGRTRANVEKNPKVCFGVAEIGRFYPGGTAMEFSNEFASVMVYGTGEVVEDENEARHAMEMLMDKYFPHMKRGRDYRAITDRELQLTSVFKIIIEQWVGKENVQPENKNGAFFFENRNSLG